jgi:hypothetical protein
MNALRAFYGDYRRGYGLGRVSSAVLAAMTALIWWWRRA